MYWINRIKPKHIPYIIFGLFFLYLYFNFLLKDSQKEYVLDSDFPVYYRTALMLREGKASEIYDYGKQLEYHTTLILGYEIPLRIYVNLPLASFIFVPLTYLEIHTAYKVFSIFNLVLLILSLFYLSRLLKVPRITLIFLALFSPLFGGIFYGQLSVILLFCLVASLYALHKENYKIAGLSLAVLVIKPQYLLLALFILISYRKIYKFVIWFIGPSVLYILLNFISLKIDGLIDLGKYIVQMKSWHGYFYNIFHFEKIIEINILVFIQLMLILLTCIALFIKKELGSSTNLFNTFSLAVWGGIVLNAHSMYADLILLVIPLFYYFSIYSKLRGLFIGTLFLVISWAFYINTIWLAVAVMFGFFVYSLLIVIDLSYD